MKGMNIYLITHDGDSHWICAFTAIEALCHFCVENAYRLTHSFDNEDDIVLLPKEEWSKRKINYNEPETFDVTFEEYMKTASSVEMFASTTYE